LLGSCCCWVVAVHDWLEVSELLWVCACAYGWVSVETGRETKKTISRK
jgi:hypothetical protein